MQKIVLPKMYMVIKALGVLFHFLKKNYIFTGFYWFRCTSATHQRPTQGTVPCRTATQQHNQGLADFAMVCKGASGHHYH
jgi:hypothetical protein